MTITNDAPFIFQHIACSFAVLSTGSSEFLREVYRSGDRQVPPKLILCKLNFVETAPRLPRLHAGTGKTDGGRHSHDDLDWSEMNNTTRRHRHQGPRGKPLG